MGRLVSYTAIARHLGQPSSARAVGTANGRNPISFIVPCHRALRGDGTLGGYYWGLERKRAMIAWEAARAGANV
jgi:AraC family transcriptional regulator of adaptative response/methylated-DNA-[protein]-cysteine methyltransferase